MNRRVIRAKIQLMIFKPFYGSLIARLQLKEHDNSLFATDGKSILVPKEFILTDEELEAVLAHETWHCALLHLFRRQKREPIRWNIAADFATNSLLQQDGFILPKGSLIDQKYYNLSAEKIYDILPKDIVKQIKVQLDLIEGGSGEEGDSEELEQEWKEAISDAIQKNKGNLPAGMEELISEILYPKLSWQEILYKYLQSSKGQNDFTAYPFDRRHIYREIYLPSLCGEMIEVCCAIDTSGSMSREELTKCFSEVRGICSMFGEYKIYFFQCDCALTEELEITSESDIPNIAKGRGGTSFVPVFKRIEEMELEYLPLIYFTDLEGEFPKIKRNDVYWVTENENHPVPFGEIIKIED